MPRVTPLVLPMVIALASPARAAEVTIRIFSECTFHGLSELTSTSTDATTSQSHPDPGPPAPARKQGPDGSACRQHDDCRGWCQGGVCTPAQQPTCSANEHCAQGYVCWNGQCVQSQQPGCSSNAQCAQGYVCWNRQCVQSQQQAPGCSSNAQCAQGFVCWNSQCVQSQQQAPGCSSNAQCAPGFVCWNSQCVQSQQPGPPPTPSPTCTANEQCGPGLVCLNGACVNPPTLRRGTELFLRQRLVALREELTFGEGPVITALASFHHVSPVELGRTLRSHRAELTGLMGDGTDDAWADRFLRRVEELELTCRG